MRNSLVTAAIATLCTIACAGSAGGGRATAGFGSDATSTAGGDAAAVIVLTGRAAESAPLADLLLELLDRQQIHPRWVREPRFDRAELLGTGASDEKAWAFISVEGRDAARLYFRGPHAQRFLLRKLVLRDGLDEVGRELIGQAVASSVAALLHSGGVGMSREEARASLDRDEQPAARSTTPAHRTGGTGAGPVHKRTENGGMGQAGATAAGALRAWLALRYEVAWSGGDLGAAHGPGAEVGIDGGRAPLIRLRLVGVHGFAQSIVSPEVEATVQKEMLRFVFDIGWPVGAGQTIALGGGGGLDVTTVAPGATPDPTVTAAKERVHSVPALRGAIRYELDVSDFRLVLAAFADASLLRTRYELDRPPSPEPIATPWHVRPGLAMVIGWHPSLGER